MTVDAVIDTEGTTALPPVVDRATWQEARDALLVREKEHTRAGDEIAAARRRLPMVEVDAATPLTGADGPTTLLAAFEGRARLVAYAQMWHEGRPAAEQCPGCTYYNSQVRELAYLHARGVTYATFAQGPYEESEAYRAFMGWDVPWYAVGRPNEALGLDGGFRLLCYLRVGDRVYETYRTTGRGVEIMSPTYGLIDMTVYGRGEPWEDSPAGWPQPVVVDGTDLHLDGRPAAQWPRMAAGHTPAP
ncbi:putative dithiol-disulfide oxidoreductase (DUF899 family) [Actinomycetospora succinea]|uniref:Putative dithiol-disulfide oxidoreductase (DUF899 family) n=1 Tax=Actinomycetospora succinea TaxID=663603 RepID=A0A4R6UM72_9PSEU|nr:DUF899 family protein [Actinomycetospora succinea]TDQ47286.1 putative dithiol-disulfide oxidoreductase (DUF899 family) [Actinomycetospora succinea]